MNTKQKKLAAKMFSLLVACAFGLMGTNTAFADFVSWNNQTGFSSLNTSDANGVDVFAISNLNTESVSSVVVGNSTTGNNTSDNNTGEGFVGSGELNIAGVILNDLNSNVVEHSGGWWAGLFSAGNDTTGANSVNDATTTASSVVAASDVNSLFLAYDVAVDGNTGSNSADENTGSGDVETGAVAGLLAASDQANHNVLVLNGDVANEDFASLAENVNTGSGSTNTSTSDVNNVIAVDGLNTAQVLNLMFMSANTGGNSASENTGEGSSVSSGDAIGGIAIQNEYNSNSTEINTLSGDGSVEALNDTTGSGSLNTASASLTDVIAVSNTNLTEIANSTAVSLDTGNNTADENTGSGDVETGNAVGVIAIDNGSGLNSNHTEINSGAQSATVLAGNSTTGANSVNDALAELTETVAVENNNTTGIVNDVTVASSTGNNSASDNTGDGSVETGHAEGAVVIANDTNSNHTVVNTAQFENIEASNDTTGANSTNTASANASSVVAITNDNVANITNNASITSNTGGNTSDSNTGSGAVSTGSASMTFGISNSGNNNVTEVGQ